MLEFLPIIGFFIFPFLGGMQEGKEPGREKYDFVRENLNLEDLERQLKRSKLFTSPGEDDEYVRKFMDHWNGAEPSKRDTLEALVVSGIKLDECMSFPGSFERNSDTIWKRLMRKITAAKKANK